MEDHEEQELPFYTPGLASVHGELFFTDGCTMWLPFEAPVKRWFVHPAIRGRMVGDQSASIPTEYAYPMTHVRGRRFRRSDGMHVGLPLHIVRAFWGCQFAQAGTVSSAIRVTRGGEIVAYTMPRL